MMHTKSACEYEIEKNRGGYFLFYKPVTFIWRSYLFQPFERMKKATT